MRHAGPAAGPVGALAIAMIEATLGALLMASPGGAKGAGAPGSPTWGTAVGMPPIAGGTEDEGLPAPPAGPAPEARHGLVGPERSRAKGHVDKSVRRHGQAGQDPVG
jgi:hypothetical protein